jgi:hypothetical protein
MKVRGVGMSPAADKTGKHMKITLETSGVWLWLFPESHDVTNRGNCSKMHVTAKESDPFRQNLFVDGSKFRACGGRWEGLD